MEEGFPALGLLGVEADSPESDTLPNVYELVSLRPKSLSRSLRWPSQPLTIPPRAGVQ